jgi:hypothetical protein
VCSSDLPKPHLRGEGGSTKKYQSIKRLIYTIITVAGLTTTTRAAGRRKGS